MAGSAGQTSLVAESLDNASYMAEQTGIRAFIETVRLVLKAGEIVLSWPQHKISNPDPEYLVKKEVEDVRRAKKREMCFIM